MKQFLMISTLGLAFLISGCSPKTAGSDSAYLNKNRGAAGAQISSAEAAQYRRQQGLSADEVRLENMKRRQATDSIEEGASAASSTSRAIGDGLNTIRNLKDLFK